MAVNRYYSAVAQDTTLTSAATNSATSIVVGAVTGFPTQYPYVLALDYGQSAEELVSVTAAAGLTLTVTRAFNGTTAAAHPVGAVVRHVIVAQDMTDLQTHIAATGAVHGVTGALAGTADVTSAVSTHAALSSGVHGVTGSIVGTTDTQTLTNKKVRIGINAQSGTTYTLVASDQDKLVTLNNSGAITLTVPSAVFSAGDIVNIEAIGAGQVTVQGDGTSTVTGTGTKLRTQYSAASVVCTASNTFQLIGDLA